MLLRKSVINEKQKEKDGKESIKDIMKYEKERNNRKKKNAKKRFKKQKMN